jgi:hypothetical protein
LGCCHKILAEIKKTLQTLLPDFNMNQILAEVNKNKALQKTCLILA